MDDLIGQQQVVIKSLKPTMGGWRGYRVQLFWAMVGWQLDPRYSGIMRFTNQLPELQLKTDGLRCQCRTNTGKRQLNRSLPVAATNTSLPWGRIMVGYPESTGNPRVGKRLPARVYPIHLACKGYSTCAVPSCQFSIWRLRIGMPTGAYTKGTGCGVADCGQRWRQEYRFAVDDVSDVLEYG